MIILGNILILLAALVLIYYVYRQTTDPGYWLFPMNYLKRYGTAQGQTAKGEGDSPSHG